MALVAFLLAPALVIASPSVSQALVPPPIVPPASTIITLGGADAGVEGLAGGGTAICVGTAGVGCLAIGAALVGVGLYATRDTWLPWVKNLFNDPGTQQTQPQTTPQPTTGLHANAACQASVYWGTNYPPGGTSPETAGIVYIDRSICTDVTTGQADNVRVSASAWKEDLTCQNSTTGVVQSAEFYQYNGVDQAGHAVTGCGSGFVPVQISLRACLAGMNAQCQDANTSFPDVFWNAGQTVGQTTLTTTVTCKNQKTQATQTVTLTSSGSAGLPLPSCAAALGPDWYGVEMQTVQCDSRSTDGTAECPTIEHVKTDNSPYPQCDGSNPLCFLRIYLDGQPCTRYIADCVDWSSHVQAAPSRYECHYGPYTVPMSDCNVLEYFYGTQTGIDTDQKTDGNPSTPPSPAPRPQPQPQPQPSPSPTSTTGTGPSPQPTPSPSSSPTAPATGGFPTTGTNPTTGDPSTDNCIGGAWSWNPVDWVVVPVECALKWAFVPSQTTTATIEGVSNDASTRQPFVFISSAAGQLGSLANPGSSCYVFSVDFPQPLGHVKGPDSCTPDPVTGQLQTYRPLLMAGIYVACFAPLCWWAWRQYSPGSVGSA